MHSVDTKETSSKWYFHKSKTTILPKMLQTSLYSEKEIKTLLSDSVHTRVPCNAPWFATRLCESDSATVSLGWNTPGRQTPHSSLRHQLTTNTQTSITTHEHSSLCATDYCVQGKKMDRMQQTASCFVYICLLSSIFDHAATLELDFWPQNLNTLSLFQFPLLTKIWWNHSLYAKDVLTQQHRQMHHLWAKIKIQILVTALLVLTQSMTSSAVSKHTTWPSTTDASKSICTHRHATVQSATRPSASSQ